MPSSNGPVTLELRYWRTGAPWGGASAGMVKPGSGCWEAAREEELASCWPLVARRGVPVRAGGAVVVVVVVVVVAAAGLGLGALEGVVAGAGAGAGAVVVVGAALVVVVVVVGAGDWRGREGWLVDGWIIYQLVV